MTATYTKKLHSDTGDILTIVMTCTEMSTGDIVMNLYINDSLHTQTVGTHPQMLEDEAIMEFEAWKQRKNVVPVERVEWFVQNGYEIVTT